MNIIRKNKALLLTFLGFSLSFSSSYAIFDNVRLGAGKLFDIFYGYSDASPEVKAKVEALCKKMGINREVPVKKMSFFNKFFYGYANSYALSPGLLDRIYVNEDWFNELTDREIDFVLAHATARIKHRDVLPHYLIFALYAAAFFKFFPEELGKTKLGKITNVAGEISVPLLMYCKHATVLCYTMIREAAAGNFPLPPLSEFVKYYSRLAPFIASNVIDYYQIKAADRAAVHALGDASLAL